MLQGRDSEGLHSGLGCWVKEGATAGVGLGLAEAEASDRSSGSPKQSPPPSQTLPALKLSQGLSR